MNENKNVPQPLDDEALDEATGGTFFGMTLPIATTMENPIVMKDQQEQVICTRCGKIRFLSVGTKKCSCGGSLKKYMGSSSVITAEL